MKKTKFQNISFFIGQIVILNIGIRQDFHICVSLGEGCNFITETPVLPKRLVTAQPSVKHRS